MALFQQSVLKKHIESLNTSIIDEKWKLFQSHFQNTIIQQNIRQLKEEQYQGEFLEDLFVKIFGYIKAPSPNFNIITEQKNITNSKKADGAIIVNDKALAVIELKGTDTTDLSKIESQAFGYKSNQPGCNYVITSNFEKLRFYIDNTTQFEEFNLFTLDKKSFELLYCCLDWESVSKNVPINLLNQSVSKESAITKQLYKDYSDFKRSLFDNLVELNPQFDKLELFKKTQKLLDRFLFIFFAEDRLLLPTNLIRRINQEWENLQKMRIPVSLYDRYKIYFNDLNEGARVTLPAFGKKTGEAIEETHDIFAYNGGLFKPDNFLDNLKIDDQLLYNYTLKLSDYDFQSEVDVNILGHIFENSLNEIDEIKSEIEGKEVDKTKTKRKKDGVFYTPKYITKYIVDNTVGKLCTEKKVEIKLIEEEYHTDKNLQTKTKKALLDKLIDYREWLLQLTICDPACGSGAFLNQALEFLIVEHRYIDELQAKLMGDSMVLSDVETSILENNIYGVDLNDESIEIAKLSLWLRTAQKGRKLNSLNNNIKCGNSLIDDPEIAGEKAFSWEKEFPEVFAKGGFDVIIGNPPYVQIFDLKIKEFLEHKFDVFKRNNDLYASFYQLSIEILKDKGILGFITPNSFVKGEYFLKLREYFIKYQILSIVDFNNFLVFDDANVFSAILIISKITPKNKWVLMSDLNTIKGEVDINTIDFIQENVISKKFIKFKRFDDYFLIKDVGFNYWSVGSAKVRGNSIGDRILYKGIRESDLDVAYVKGSNFNKYSKIETENYLRHNFNDFLNSNDVFRFSDELLKTKPKLFYRQTSSSLISTIDNDGLYCDKTVHIIINKKGFSINILYLMTIFNSSLLNYLYKLLTEESGRAFAQVKTINVKQLPFILTKNDQPFIEKAELMLSINKDFYSTIQKFTTYFSSQYKLEKLSGKLEKWYELTFVDFIKELNKAIKTIKGTPLTKKDELEWMDVFEDYKKQVLVIKAEIYKTDKEIDQMVYELYGLSEEEIKIVEGE